MYIVIISAVSAIILTVFLLSLIRDKIQFYVVGFDEGFSFSEIAMLRSLARRADVDEPMSLYVSLPTLNDAITRLIADMERTTDVGVRTRTQALLSKLYDYRTKVQLAHENKRGVESTRYLSNGQRLRIVLDGSGVFTSEIVNNGRELLVRTPTKDGAITRSGDEWVGKTVTVYLCRKGDAHYVFDTRVTAANVFCGVPVIHLAQTGNLLRTQKRRSVRCQCEIPARLYFLPDDGNVDYNAVEAEAGYRCLLEDISEDGALVRVGGKGKNGARIRLQFSLNDMLVLMFGVVRAVEYSQSQNQSRLHFECVHIAPDMRNLVLSFVYKVLPQRERDAHEALAGAEADAEVQAGDDAEADTDDFGAPQAQASAPDPAPVAQEHAADSVVVDEDAAVAVANIADSNDAAHGGVHQSNDIAVEAAAFVVEARRTLASGMMKVPQGR